MARIGAAIGGMNTTAVKAGMPESAVGAGAGAVETEGMAGVCAGGHDRAAAAKPVGWRLPEPQRWKAQGW